MESREILFEKIHTKKKEWESQLKNLESKVSGLNSEKRKKVREQIDYLNSKFKEVEKRTNELRNASADIQQDLGDTMVRSWLDLLAKIDKAMSKLKK